MAVAASSLKRPRLQLQSGAGRGVAGRSEGRTSGEKTNPLEPLGKDRGLEAGLKGGASGRRTNHFALAP